MVSRGKTYEKPLSEAETRAKLYSLARWLGCDVELRQIFDRYDRLMKNCTDPNEKKQMSVMANVEVHRLFNFRDALVVSGQMILPADPDYKPEE